MSDTVTRLRDIASYGSVYECADLYKAADEIERLRARVAELKAELEREQMRLAGCSVAALGYFDDCSDEYKSAALSDVLQLHAKVAELETDAARYREVRTWHVPQFQQAFKDCLKGARFDGLVDHAIEARTINAARGEKE